MKSLIIASFLTLIRTIPGAAQVAAMANKPLCIGEVRTVRSAVLHEDRTLNVYLPYGYDRRKAYPVIYVLDGTINEDFLHIAGLVQYFHMTFKMPDCIVVGIANIDRKRDFIFPTKDTALLRQYPTTGQSAAFISFLERELLPYINSQYKTTPVRYLIGQSAGGLLGSEVLLRKPTMFTHYLLVSPSLWWDDESLLRQADSLLARQNAMPEYVYISAGAEEDEKVLKDARALYELIHKKGVKADYLELPHENHATVLHQAINEAFKKLYPYKE